MAEKPSHLAQLHHHRQPQSHDRRPVSPQKHIPHQTAVSVRQSRAVAVRPKPNSTPSQTPSPPQRRELPQKDSPLRAGRATASPPASNSGDSAPRRPSPPPPPPPSSSSSTHSSPSPASRRSTRPSSLRSRAPSTASESVESLSAIKKLSAASQIATASSVLWDPQYTERRKPNFLKPTTVRTTLLEEGSGPPGGPASEDSPRDTTTAAPLGNPGSEGGNMSIDKRHPSSFQQLEKLGEGTYATVRASTRNSWRLQLPQAHTHSSLGFQRTKPTDWRAGGVEGDPPGQRGGNSLHCYP
jgi:hypothetical protein